MASNSEVGHAKNVANFDHLTNMVTGFGTTYNPTIDRLKIAELQNLFNLGKQHLSETSAKNLHFNNITNNRMIEFANLPALATRMVNALEVTNANKELIKDAKTINRKMQGKRASKPNIAIDPSTPAPKTISTSQQSYDMLAEHFSKLVQLLKSEESYAPNETDLTIVALQAKVDKLYAESHNVSVAYSDLRNARDLRNKTLYGENGITDTAADEKNM